MRWSKQGTNISFRVDGGQETSLRRHEEGAHHRRTFQAERAASSETLKEDLAVRSRRRGEELKKKQGWEGFVVWLGGQILETVECGERNKFQYKTCFYEKYSVIVFRQTSSSTSFVCYSKYFSITLYIDIHMQIHSQTCKQFISQQDSKKLTET